MSFLASQWLWWGLAAIAPIMIHLWHKKERQSIRFFGLRFVQHRSHAQQFSAVHQWLLLLLRILVLICFALAMSEPMIQWPVERSASAHFVHPRAAIASAARNAGGNQRSSINGSDTAEWYWLCDDELRSVSQAACQEPAVASALSYVAEAMPELKELRLHLPDGPFYGATFAQQLPFELIVIRAEKTQDLVQPSFTVKANNEWQSLLSSINTTHQYERWRWLENGTADVVLDASYLPAKVHWHSQDDLLWSSTKNNALPSYVDGDVLHIKLGSALTEMLAQSAVSADERFVINEPAAIELAELLALSYQWLTRFTPPIVERASMGRPVFLEGQAASKTISLHFLFWLLAMVFLVAERVLTNMRVHARD